MRHKFYAIIAVLLLAFPAYAQKSKSTLQSEITSSFPDQNTGAITPAIVRGVFSDFVNSWQQYTAVNAQVGTSYTAQGSDYGQVITVNNSNPIAVTLPTPSGSFGTFNVYILNTGTGTATITPASGTINGAANITLAATQSAWFFADGTGTNYGAIKNSTGGTVSSVTCGTGLSGGTITTVGTCALINPVALNLGGTNAALTASNGGIVYSSGTALAILSGTATANLPLLSGASTTPSWATITYPGSGTSGGVAYFSSNTALASSGVLGANQVVIGGGAGSAPTSVACGTSTTVLHGGAPPSCGQIVAGDVTTNTITNSNMAQVPAVTFKGNPTNALANIQDFTVAGLTNSSSPDASNDYLVIWDHTSGTFKKINPGTIASSATAGVASLASLTGALTMNTTSTIKVGAASTTITLTAPLLSSAAQALLGGM